MKELLDKSLILFGGKGGTGKTTIAAATALKASEKHKVLILSTDPAHSLSDSFGKIIGDKITKIKENLYASEMDAASLLEEYKKKYGGIMKQIINEGTFFSNEDIQEFFELSLPGMDELMALMKIIDILEEREYDLLILDTAPTGHTIRLLESPDLMSAYIKVLTEMRQKHRVVVSMLVGKYIGDKADKFIDKLHKDMERVKVTLKDPAKTKFIPIAIPEAMSVYENEKLISMLEKHHIPVGMILVNGVMNENHCEFCKSIRTNQEKYIKEISKKFTKYKVKEIPLFANEIMGRGLEVFSRALFEKKYRSLKPKAAHSKVMPKFDSLKIGPNLKFLLLGGKGGTGKTSCAAAIALHESERKKILIFSTDPAHSLSDSFGVKIGNSITKINNNLDALEIDSYARLNELKARYRKEISSFFSSAFKPTATIKIDVPYDRRVMEDLFDLCPPGIDEIMALKTMMDLMEAGAKDRAYDLFILDTAPTGHAIRLLEMPEIAEEWVSALLRIQETYPISFEIGNIISEMLGIIKKVRNILVNPEKTEFIAVTIPEAMCLLETQDLVSRLRSLGVPARHLIINKIFPECSCVFCTAKRAEQVVYVRKLKKLGLKTIGIRLFDKEIRGDNLNKLAKIIFKTSKKRPASKSFKSLESKH